MAKSGQHNSGEKSGKSADIYRDIVVSTNMLIWRTDLEGRFSFLNPAWEKNSGYMIEETLGKPFSKFLIPEASEHYINAFRNCLIGEPVIGHETTYLSRSGEEIHLMISMIPLYDESGAIVGTQGTAHDITEERHADKLLQYINAKDELTGLYNLHTFLSMTEQQIKTANRENKKLLIICAGVDHMEAVNTIHGRDAGDHLLVDTADILKKTFRETDLLARTGGDEFVVSTLVSAENTEEIIMVRLHDNIDKYNVDKTGSLKLALSFGTAFYNPEHPVPIEKVLSDADAMMHENK